MNLKNLSLKFCILEKFFFVIYVEHVIYMEILIYLAHEFSYLSH